MAIRSYHLQLGKIEREGFEFSGKHYLPKEKVREVFGWGEDTVCDLAKNSHTFGYFVTLANQEAFYHDQCFLWIKKSIIEFPPSHVNLERFQNLSWLEKKILATQN